ncbi:MAG: alkaline phosphatase family protein [Burkholderiaceae bacterium]
MLNPGLPGYPDVTATHAISEALSPDGKTLAVLTSGYNRWSDPATFKAEPSLQNEFVFLYDVASGSAKQKQVLSVPNTFAGLTFSPDGNQLYVSGGKNDNVHVFTYANAAWSEQSLPIKLNHTGGIGAPGTPSSPAGLATTADGSRLVVTNFFNDSVSILDLKGHVVAGEIDLRPGKNGAASGSAGGTYPFWVSVKENTTAYVASTRDREIVVLDLATTKITGRIPLPGNPLKMILNKAQSALLVAMDNADAIAVIDTVSNTLRSTVRTVAPIGTSLSPKGYTGAAPNALALSTDESTLYVTNNGTNSVAVIKMQPKPTLIGLIPTAWSPQDIVYDKNADMLYVINSKSVPGPNPGYCSSGDNGKCLVTGSPVKDTANQYVLQLSKAGIQSVPVPTLPAVLAQLTSQVAANNSFGFLPSADDTKTMSFLKDRIKHVIYIVRENRTYDQVLGDLGKGNGDKTLTEFPAVITPNQHALANRFVVLDNFYDPGEVSANGWPWSTAARESDLGVKVTPVNYGDRGLSADHHQSNRGVPVGQPLSVRQSVLPNIDPDTLAGDANAWGIDGPSGERQQGFLWDSALRAGKSVRNYGFLVTINGPIDRNPYTNKVPQVTVNSAGLGALTDVYFRGYDNAFPDFYREIEWEREFNQYVSSGDLPALSLVRFASDHTGSFAKAIDGVNTPETQVATNDYAVGKLIEAVSKSPYAKDTLIFVVEDDCQDGPDHVDEHRSIAFVAGPYVKQGGQVISTRYSTVNMLRSIEDILGIGYLSLNDSTQAPMTDVFDITQSGAWTYIAQVPAMLRSTSLPLPAPTVAYQRVNPRHDVRYWSAVTKGLDFRQEDLIEAGTYNRILWTGIMGNTAYPSQRSRKDLSPRKPTLN